MNLREKITDIILEHDRGVMSFEGAETITAILAAIREALPEKDEDWKDTGCEGCKYCLFPKGWNACREEMLKTLKD